jgi:hypothetical protein
MTRHDDQEERLHWETQLTRRLHTTTYRDYHEWLGRSTELPFLQVPMAIYATTPSDDDVWHAMSGVGASYGGRQAVDRQFPRCLLSSSHPHLNGPR